MKRTRFLYILSAIIIILICAGSTGAEASVKEKTADGVTYYTASTEADVYEALNRRYGKAVVIFSTKKKTNITIEWDMYCWGRNKQLIIDAPKASVCCRSDVGSIVLKKCRAFDIDCSVYDGTVEVDDPGTKLTVLKTEGYGYRITVNTASADINCKSGTVSLDFMKKGRYSVLMGTSAAVDITLRKKSTLSVRDGIKPTEDTTHVVTRKLSDPRGGRGAVPLITAYKKGTLVRTADTQAVSVVAYAPVRLELGGCGNQSYVHLKKNGSAEVVSNTSGFEPYIEKNGKVLSGGGRTEAVTEALSFSTLRKSGTDSRYLQETFDVVMRCDTDGDGKITPGTEAKVLTPDSAHEIAEDIYRSLEAGREYCFLMKNNYEEYDGMYGYEMEDMLMDEFRKVHPDGLGFVFKDIDGLIDYSLVNEECLCFPRCITEDCIRAYRLFPAITAQAFSDAQEWALEYLYDFSNSALFPGILDRIYAADSFGSLSDTQKAIVLESWMYNHMNQFIDRNGNLITDDVWGDGVEPVGGAEQYGLYYGTSLYVYDNLVHLIDKASYGICTDWSLQTVDLMHLAGLRAYAEIVDTVFGHMVATIIASNGEGRYMRLIANNGSIGLSLVYNPFGGSHSGECFLDYEAQKYNAADSTCGSGWFPTLWQANRQAYRGYASDFMFYTPEDWPDAFK